MGSPLLVININRIRFVFNGTGKFLAIMVRLLFSGEWPTSCNMVNYFAEMAPQGQKGNEISSVGATNAPTLWVSALSFGHVPCCGEGQQLD